MVSTVGIASQIDMIMVLPITPAPIMVTVLVSDGAQHFACRPATADVLIAVMIVPSMIANGRTVSGSLRTTISMPYGIPGVEAFALDSAAHFTPAMFISPAIWLGIVLKNESKFSPAPSGIPRCVFGGFWIWPCPRSAYVFSVISRICFISSRPASISSSCCRNKISGLIVPSIVNSPYSSFLNRSIDRVRLH